jgi:hypothetical protein
MKANIKIMLFAGIFLAAVGGAILVLHFTRDFVPDDDFNRDPTPPDGYARVITNVPADEISVIRIVNRTTDDDGYQIRASAGASGFHVLEINQRTPIEQRERIPYNQELFTEIAGLVTQLSALRLVEENAQDLAQYGLTNETQNARVGLTFRDQSRIAFMLGNPTPVGLELYFRLSDSSDVYTVRLSDVSPLLAGQYHWLSRVAFPAIDPNIEVERLLINRVDWDEEGSAPMIIEPIPTTGQLEDLRTHNRHRLTSPVEVEVCAEVSLPIIRGLFGLTAAQMVAFYPAEDELSAFGFGEGLRLAAAIEARTADGEIYTLRISTYVENELGENVGWFGTSTHVPGAVFLFDPEMLPWLVVSVDHLLASSLLQPYIYSVDTLTLETAQHTLNFRIVGDNENNSIFWDENPLQGHFRDTDSQRGRFHDLYLFLLSAITEELFLDDNPPGSQFIARVTYRFRDENREDDVVEYFTSDDFTRSIVRLNGTNLYKIRAAYTTRLLSNINAFASGGEIINDF